MNRELDTLVEKKRIEHFGVSSDQGVRAHLPNELGVSDTELPRSYRVVIGLKRRICRVF